MKSFFLCLLWTVVLASNSEKLFYYGEPIVTTQTGFIKVDPQTNAWEPAADGFATSELVGAQAVKGFIIDSNHSSFLFGQFSLWNGTYVGAMINTNLKTMEPYVFNSGILGESVNGMTYFDNYQQVALIGRFWGFQQNPSQSIQFVGACSVVGTPCYPLGQGLEDFVDHGDIQSLGDNLFALYTDSKGARVVYLNITGGYSGNWETIFTSNRPANELSLEIFQGSLWLIGKVPTPDGQAVSAASWNIDESSWEYMDTSQLNQSVLYGLPVTSVSPDGQSLYAIYSLYSNQFLKWDNIAGNWTLFYSLNCFFSAATIASSNEGMFVGCNSSMHYITSEEDQIMDGLNCSTTWVTLQVSKDNSRLFSFCQTDAAGMQSSSYDLTSLHQVINYVSTFQMMQLKFDAMCVYGSKIFISGPFTKVKDTTAWGMAIWDNDKKQWFAILNAVMGLECHCDTDGNELAVVCLAVGGTTYWPLLMIDDASSDLGSGPYAQNIQMHNLTDLVPEDTFAYADDLKLVDDTIYFAIVAIGGDSFFAKWTAEKGAEVIVTLSMWEIKFAVLDNVGYFSGFFYYGGDYTTTARYDLITNQWLPMDQLTSSQNTPGQTHVVVLWNNTAQIYVGGQFTNAGDMKVSNWLGYNTEGKAADSVTGGVTGTVNFLQPLGDKMYILSAPQNCRSVYQPSCGSVLYYDGVQLTYSYPIASGVGAIAAGYDVPKAAASSSSSGESDSFLVAIVISGVAFLVASAGIGGFILFRKCSSKRNAYHEIPDVKEAVRASQIDFQHEQFVLKSVLGRGAYGTVWSCVFPHRAGGTYAVKQMLFSKGDTKKIEIVKKEIELLEKFRHPHIVHYCGSRVESTDTSVEFFIFMELYEHPCSLKGVIQKALKQTNKRKNHFTYAEIKNYLFQIADGLNYLHNQGVAHRDLKCANILIRSKGAVVNSLHIADFGISKAMSAEGGNVLASTVLGTPSFMAPEVLKNQLYDAFKADIWSFGMLMFEMLSWKEPEIPGKRPEFPEEAQIFMQQDHRFLSVLEIFEKCSQEDPNARPTASELLYLCENLP